MIIRILVGVVCAACLAGTALAGPTEGATLKEERNLCTQLGGCVTPCPSGKHIGS